MKARMGAEDVRPDEYAVKREKKMVLVRLLQAEE